MGLEGPEADFFDREPDRELVFDHEIFATHGIAQVAGLDDELAFTARLQIGVGPVSVDVIEWVGQRLGGQGGERNARTMPASAARLFIGSSRCCG